MFPERNQLKSNCYINFTTEQLSSIYLLNDEKCKSLKDKGAILVGEVGEEIEVISLLFLLNEDYKFDKKLKIGGTEFTKWQDLEKYALAVSEILIFDPFILSDTSLIESNLLPFLKVMAKKASNKLNILVFVSLEKTSVQYQTISSSIRQAVKEVTSISPNFTMITVRNQRGEKSNLEHDRTIFTNYFRVYSGDSFNYFKSDGTKITNGRELHIASYGDKENHRLAQELLYDIQTVLENLPIEQIQGDKKSNFLNFT
jgi:hypothetical protein